MAKQSLIIISTYAFVKDHEIQAIIANKVLIMIELMCSCNNLFLLSDNYPLNVELLYLVGFVKIIRMFRIRVIM